MPNFATFRSQLERRVALPLVAATTIPIFFVAMASIAEVRDQSLDFARSNLRAIAKEQGMLLAERFLDLVGEVRLRHTHDTGVTGSHHIRSLAHVAEPPPPRPTLIQQHDDLVLRVPMNDGFVDAVLDTPALFNHSVDLPNAIGCVAIAPKVCLESDPATELRENWTLRLAGNIATDIEFNVFAVQARSVALGNIATVATVLPYAVTLIAILVAYGVLLFIRRQLRPLPRLKQAIADIEAGRYEQRVKIDASDEFQELGEAFNGMSEKLESSFGYLAELATIDELILSGAAMPKVVDRVNLAILRMMPANTSLVVFVENDGTLCTRGLNPDGEFENHLEMNPISCVSADEMATAAAESLSESEWSSFPILDEGAEVGALVIFGGHDEPQDTRVEELARRLSVAHTHIHRAETLYQQATYDGLTGLFNRRAFLDHLSRRIRDARRRNTEGVLLFLDLDRFKLVNDTEGHAAGDRLLRGIADRLRRVVRETDVVARLGGDEFAVAGDDLNDEGDLLGLLQRIEHALSEPISVARLTHRPRASIGVCLFPRDGDDAGTLLKNADVAMYKAKAMGGGYAFFDHALNDATERRVRLEHRLREALADDRLVLNFQPKLDLKSGTVSSVEGLARWHDAEFGWVPPVEFIDVAERTGLITEFDRTLITRAGDLFSRALEAGIQLDRIGLNLSPRQLRQIHFSKSFLAALRDAGCPPDCIEVEVTESVLIADSASVIGHLWRLREAGVRVALDDFGTGFSSLNMLRELPIDTLKIDKSFIDDLPNRSEAVFMATKIIEIAHGLSLDVVAEGVETDAQLACLRMIGCDHVQGYLVSPALSVDELIEFLDVENPAIVDRPGNLHVTTTQPSPGPDARPM